MSRSIVLALMIAFAAQGLGAQPPVEYGRLPDGRPVTSLGDAATKAVVLFFVASDCPISNRTFPEMKRVREEFSAQGVRVWFVYPNVGELPRTVEDHQASFDKDGAAILDTAGVLTRLSGAKGTPEAVVLKPMPGMSERARQWRPVYAGRVDNRYIRLGLERPQATEHFAERAVREVLSGLPVEQPVGGLVGCAIVSPAPVASNGGHAR